MTAPNSLIRRDAALDALARVGILPEDAAMDAIRALPADPVGEAAGRLAELLMSDLDERESMGHEAWDEALTAVRAAVAGIAHLHKDVVSIEQERDAALRGFGLLPDDPREIRRYAEVFAREIRECPPKLQDRPEMCPCVSVITAHVRRMIVERLDAMKALQAEREKFQQETLRTSALTQMLLRVAGEIVTWDGAPGDFSRRALADEIHALIATPLNVKVERAAVAARDAGEKR